MSSEKRAVLYCNLIKVAQDRMAKGAELAFSTNPDQQAACQRMLRYITLIRWLYSRALRADEATAVAFREGCIGRPWPYGGLDGQDFFFLRAMATGRYQDVTEAYAQ